MSVDDDTQQIRHYFVKYTVSKITIGPTSKISKTPIFEREPTFSYYIRVKINVINKSCMYKPTISVLDTPSVRFICL